MGLLKAIKYSTFEVFVQMEIVDDYEPEMNILYYRVCCYMQEEEKDILKPYKKVAFLLCYFI